MKLAAPAVAAAAAPRFAAAGALLLVLTGSGSAAGPMPRQQPQAPPPAARKEHVPAKTSAAAKADPAILAALRFARADRTGDADSLLGDGTQALTVVVFVSARCPCSADYEARVAALAREHPSVRFVRVYSEKNDPLDVMRRQSAAFSQTGPRSASLFDFKARLADLLGAEVTPEVFVLDRAGAVRYRGRIDDDQEEKMVRRRDLRLALAALLAGKAPPVAVTEPFGCTLLRPDEPDVPGRMKGMKHSAESAGTAAPGGQEKKP
jgi:hypothetical protein